MAAPQSALAAIYRAIKKLASNPEAQDLASNRARTLSEQVDLSRYSPATIARATTGSPMAQRGFSEALGSTRSPFASTLIRPSQWAEHTPALDPFRDRNIIEYLKGVLPKEKLKEAPFLWVNDRPGGLEAGFEGRHRMKAMQELYGDDPVLTNLLPGQEFKLQELDYPKGMWDERVQGPNRMSPLEMLRQQIMFGDKPIDISPLWVNEK